MNAGLPKILVVDDEPHLLEGLKRGLRKSFEVRCAASGPEGLQVLGAETGFAVVMSDMRMPVMNGAAFLAKVRNAAPEAVRLLLTGQSDMDDAIAAINDGHIFRFLKKPCAPELLQATLAAALEQYRLVTAERDLLEQTLRGSIQALTDTLALANPAIFGMATRVKRCASALAAKLGHRELWQLEVAAMVCQLGAVTLPAGVFERRARSEGLLDSERVMLERVPSVTDQLLAPIPRLDAVREIVRHSRASFTGGGEVPLGARILKVALDFDELEASGATPTRAIERLRSRTSLYDPAVIEALASLHAREARVTEVRVMALLPGMILAADVMTRSGTLLIARGHAVTPGLVLRLENFASSLVSDTVTVET